MKIKTSELSGTALDWAVAKCEGHEIDSLMGGAVWYWVKGSLTGEPEVVEVFRPSSDWGFGGPIVEEQRIYVKPNSSNDGWRSYVLIGGGGIAWAYFGPTPLIAAMRCYVGSKLGDEIDVPEELV